MKVRALVLLIAAIMQAGPAAAQKPLQGNWPSFRGDHAAGVADGQNLPDQWDGEKGTNVKWKTAIPGLSHSSPVLWGDQLFLTTAISSRGAASFKKGLYGDGDASDDRSEHTWKIYCLDRRTGKVIWERVSFQGVPREKRHIKATYANATPATDGRYVVAFFGSQGLYAYDMKGKLVWRKDMGRLNAGAYDLPDYEWGTASSPIIYRASLSFNATSNKGHSSQRWTSRQATRCGRRREKSCRPGARPRSTQARAEPSL